jgi:hypothetical protein
MMSLVSSPAAADVLLNMGAPNSTTSRSAGSGPGQLVNVSTDTLLTNVGFYSAAPNGGNLEYMIWDGTNSNLLFSIVGTGPVGSSPTLTYSPNFSFNLLAGSSYYFGIMADAAANFGYTFPPVTISQNGLTATGENSNYTNFGSPAVAGGGGASINLVLLGSQAGAVPEPATWAMMLIGFGAIGLSMRARRRQVLSTRAA